LTEFLQCGAEAPHSKDAPEARSYDPEAFIFMRLGAAKRHLKFFGLSWGF
jgi:hypothetical protein